ncbi:MAG: hypothetical protein DMG62_24320 [Acidobacteria bacterium]|nr:MAG: hypothetical protein DMG62_24320 [Acidobacteriota bacterium]
MVSDFQPFRVIRQVGIAFPFGHDPLKVFLTRKSEELFSTRLDVVAIQETFASFRYDPTKSLLAIN